MKKKMHFLKVVFSVIIVFTSSFIMSSCGEEETTSIVSDYEQFENNFDEHYPDGYTMEDGWYSVRRVNTIYYVDSDQQDVNYFYGTGCTDFVGDLEFSDSLGIKGMVTSFSMNWAGTSTTCYEDGSMKSYNSDRQTRFDGSNYSKIENSELRDFQENWGGRLEENLPFIFCLGTKYNSLSIYSDIISDYSVLDEKSIRMIYNMKSRDLPSGTEYTEYIDTYTFDDDFKLIENRQTKHTEVAYASNYYYTDSTITMTPTEEIEVDVPTEYDSELPSSYFDELEIEI